MINEIAPHIFNNHYDASVMPKDEDFVLCYRDNEILLKQTTGQPEIPLYRDIIGNRENGMQFLFGLDTRNCFLLEDDSRNNGLLDFHDVWTLRFSPRTEQAWIGAVGLQLKRWYDNNRYCGRCGTKNALKENERAITCPSCRHTVYPQIAPAIIVAITCNDKILLARGKNYKGNFYALIAGYTDVGESLEETVVREVKEETGLDVKNIRYYMSQPWPFSGSMMVGFTAEADDRQPVVTDDHEIEEAAWFSRGNLPPHASGISISGALIEAFEKGMF